MLRPRLFTAILLAAATPAFALTATGAPKADDNATANDVFVDLANQKNDTGIASAPPGKLSETKLPWDAAPGAPFAPGKKITTQAELDAELVRMRAKYAPFLRELAPPLPVTRKRVALEKFQWRVVASEMTTNEKGEMKPLPKVIPVDSPWKEVTIPHYWGPINKAEAHYRKELDIGPDLLAAESLWLHFDAVDYIAEVYLNGKKIGAHEGLFGAFEFDIKPFAKAGKNELEVRVFNDATMMGDNFFLGPNRKFGKKIAACGGPGWDEPGLAKGWHMCPVGFGIWQSCRLEARPKAFINDLFVRPLPADAKAEVYVEIPDTAAKDSVLSWSLYGQNFSAKLGEGIRPTDMETVAEAPGATGFTRLKFTVPVPRESMRLWSLDEPWLYQIQVSLARAGATVDAAKRDFGMRAFTQSQAGPLKGRFLLNGKEIKLRGANMMGNLMQCVIRKTPDQLRDDILLAKIANMTFWRMTQQPCQPEVYDMFDKLGLLAQTDMPLFVNIRRDQADECRRQLGEMIRLVRGHPSNALVSYLNEPGSRAASLSNGEVAAAFRLWDADAESLNPGQVIKWLDGDYQNISQTYSDHHDYGIWYGDSIRSTYFNSWRTAPTKSGWMRGMGEFGAEGLDSIACMERHYPAEWRTPAPDGSWSPSVIPRCQALSVGGKWFSPKPRTMAEWVDATQEHQMWGVRLMTESLRRAPVINSFAVHLLIDAWPAGWLKSLVDCDRQAKPAYFAYRDALTPLAVNLRPDSFFGYTGDTLKVHAWVLNDTAEVPAGATLRYQAELDGKVVATGRAPADIVASAPSHQGVLELKLPAVDTRRPLTVRLGLFSKDGALIHDTTVPIDLIPAADKSQKIPDKGGRPQRLIR